VTSFLLIRHGETDWIGKGLSGRMPHVHLNQQGRAQAEGIVSRANGVNRIYSSPLERSLETAAPLAGHLNLAVEIEDQFTEIDFGRWTGRAYADLAGEADWHNFNSFRSVAPVPGGESMLAVQSRAIAAVYRIAQQHPDAHVAVFSHCDVIRAVLAHLLGMPLSHLLQFRIDPASFSSFILSNDRVEVLGINHLE
jgi:broad specificity phosphatase PhoE